VQLSFLGHAQAVNGNREDALRTLERLIAQSAERYISPYELGLIYEALGDRDQAFARHWSRRLRNARRGWFIWRGSRD